MLKISIQSIPHTEQRYDTSGDYWMDDAGTVQVRVSELGNEYEELCVALHELIEMFLAKKKGLDWKSIDHFDKIFELDREEGNTDEPGDHPDSPYRLEHRFAENIERLVAERFGIDWKEYEDKIYELF